MCPLGVTAVGEVLSEGRGPEVGPTTRGSWGLGLDGEEGECREDRGVPEGPCWEVVDRPEVGLTGGSSSVDWCSPGLEE